MALICSSKCLTTSTNPTGRLDNDHMLLIGFDGGWRLLFVKGWTLKLQDYLQIKAAAAFLGVSASTLRNWERSGKLVAHRHPINGYRLYRKSDLEAILAAITKPEVTLAPNDGQP